MKLTLLKASLILTIMLCPIFSFGQRTGSFDTSILFKGKPSNLAFYVPTNYNSSLKYRLMVCLHVMGDSSNTYRNTVINNFRWHASLPNTIFIFPSSEKRNSDYYATAGSELIIQQSILVAKAKYQIDTNDIILQGFGEGGKAALRYGLDNPATFKGLLLNTPAIHGVKESLNGHPAVYSFNYSNAPNVPIFITIGDNDLANLGILDSTHEQLVLHNGITKYVKYPAIGYSIPPILQMLGFISLFDSPSHIGTDAEAVRLSAPAFVCYTDSMKPTLLFRNTGTDTITSLKLNATYRSTTSSIYWTGTLLPFQHANIPFYVTGILPGKHSLLVKIDSVNNKSVDVVPLNNTLSGTINRKDTALLSLNEGFEEAIFPPAGWESIQSGDFYTSWERQSGTSKSGTKSAGAYNFSQLFENAGRSEDLITPLIKIHAGKPELSFYVTYNYHRYGPPFYPAFFDLADTLSVLISTDCGGHYDLLYKKGGTELATFSTPKLNPIYFIHLIMKPADSNWRKVTIDLSQYQHSGSPAFIKFRYTSANGGSIFLDDIAVKGTLSIDEEIARDPIQMLPNPASSYVTINHKQDAITRVDVYDLSGRKLLSAEQKNPGANHLRIDTDNLPAGMYMLHAFSTAGVTVEKLTIVR